MRCVCLKFLLVSQLFLTTVCSAQDNPEEVAKAFLPPRAQFAEFVRSDPKTGETIQRSPAILSGHIVSQKSDDIVFAYQTRLQDPQIKSLFVALLHKAASGYVKVYEITYYQRYLWAQDFSTVGLKLVPLRGTDAYCLAVTTAVGASLGATVEVLRWDDTQGLVNVMLTNGSVYHVSFLDDKEGLSVTLSFEKYPGEKGVQPPILYRWDGRKFTKVK